MRFRTLVLSSLFPAILVCGPLRGQEAIAHDGFHHLVQINKASLVMLDETGLVSRPLAAAITDGLERIIAEQGEPGARRSSDYLVLERRLLELAGPDASRIHMGRSRQDIGSTLRRLAAREALLDSYEALEAPRAALLGLASRHVGTIIPAYTHGVQAQPTSLAHYLLAFASALERDAERLEQAYGRINRSPLGAAALGTSGFPIDRDRLAVLMGFEGLVENSYDANLVSSVDSKVELAHALATSAVHVGQFTEDLQTQYHDPAPWILLGAGQTGVSSLMPQKRNPLALERLRAVASTVIGEAHAVVLLAHNTSTGMADYRPADQLLEVTDKARDMYRRYADLVSGLAVDPARSLREVDSDYSTMTEVADALLRHADVPFRAGHHYASELTNHGRREGKTPKELSDEELRRVYVEASGGDELPVAVDVIRDALDAEKMVAGRRGTGGPQPAEAERMLAVHRDRLSSSRAWLAAERSRLQDAETDLERAFRGLSGVSP